MKDFTNNLACLWVWDQLNANFDTAFDASGKKALYY